MRRRGLIAFAEMLVTLGVLITAGPALAGPAYEPTPPAFCEQPVLHDYLAPVKRMPALREPPPLEHSLPFGPSRLDLRISEGLLPGGGVVNYSFSRDGHAYANLGWQLTATLTRVDARGRPVGKPSVVRQKLRRVGDWKGVHGDFTLGKETAVYRLTVELDNRGGSRLGVFGAYTRVVPVTSQPRLASNADSFHPGGTVFARIEDLGTTTVTYGVDYGIERLGLAGWDRAPESPTGPWILIAFTVFPGEAGRCSGFGIPPTMPPGHYRITKWVTIEPASRTAEVRPERLPLSAEFDVLP